MLVLMGRMLADLYEEGDGICRQLQKGLERTPGKRMPCTKVSYYVEPIDLVAFVESGGQHVARVATNYRFDDNGDLARVESDLGDDGEVEIAYECSAVGKILMPLTNYDAWISYSMIQGLSKDAASARREVADEGNAGVSGLHTKLMAVGDSRFTISYQSETHGDGGQLVRRVVRGTLDGALTTTSYEYDGQGDMVSRQVVQIDHPNAFTRRTDYTYKCWD